MRWMLAFVLLLAACKKSKTEDEESEPAPTVVDIQFQMVSATEGTLSFRVVDAKVQPIAPAQERVDVEVTAKGIRGCDGWAMLDPAEFVGPEKRVTGKKIAFDIPCTPAGQLTEPQVRVKVGEMLSFARGEAHPDKLSFPDSRPAASPELDAAIKKLGENARTAPKSAPACADVSLPMDELTQVEAISLAQLSSWAGDPPGTSVVVATKLFHDLMTYRVNRTGDAAKLRERIDVTKYVIAVRVETLVKPELASTSSYKPGKLEATALVLEPSTGKWLCAYPVRAQSSGAVKLDGALDVLERDFEGQTWKAFEESTKRALPKVALQRL